MDEQFTARAMRDMLLKHHTVIHIASHFRFQPGNEAGSFLLLGDGTRLSLSDLKTMPSLFGGVQLLTLSACDTGIGDTVGDGTEIEGFGVLAQKKGAKAVVASLWPVADESTSKLMQEFYRFRQGSPRASKAEALRQAQLALLHGRGAPAGSARNRGVTLADPLSSGEKSAPSFPIDPNTPFAHPYYWAPFFLMGNWL